MDIDTKSCLAVVVKNGHQDVILAENLRDVNPAVKSVEDLIKQVTLGLPLSQKRVNN